MRRTETEMRAYVEEFERSGLRLIDFCRERGLSPKTVYTWRKRYSSNDVGEASFLPLQIKEDDVAAEGCVNSARMLTFKTQKFCLEVALDARHNHADTVGFVREGIDCEKKEEEAEYNLINLW